MDRFSPEMARLIASGEVELEFEEVESTVEDLSLLLPAGYTSLAHLQDTLASKLIWTPEDEPQHPLSLILP
jgi:hypothetical protein